MMTSVLVSPSAANLQQQASALLESIADGVLRLPDNPDLLADLGRLRIVERGMGFRLESPRGSFATGTRHGDTASALCLALAASNQFQEPAGPLIAHC